MATQSQAFGPKHDSLVVRRATPADADVCGRICFEAFDRLATQHNFPRDFPAPDSCGGVFDDVLASRIFLRCG